MDLEENIAMNIKKLRKDLNLTQEEFSQKIHISRTTISKWETKELKPKINDLVLISKIFQFDINSLLGINIKQKNYFIQ